MPPLYRYDDLTNNYIRLKMPVTKLLKTLRPSFLVLTPAYIFLGLSTSLHSQHSINYSIFMLILFAAFCAHISVNTLNEYFDFKSGLDFKTRKTAFSGGSGALPDNPQLARMTLTIGVVSLLVMISIGLYLLKECGLQILPIGLSGVALILSYTQWLNRFPVACLIAPGLGFGVLMVVGTHVLLTGEQSLLVWLASLVAFFFANNLLLLNQYPDIAADASIGRRTFPIAFGVKTSNLVYLFNMLASCSIILFFIANNYVSSLGYIALLPLLFSAYSLYGANKYLSAIADHPRYLAANVLAALLTPVLLGISLIYA